LAEQLRGRLKSWRTFLHEKFGVDLSGKIHAIVNDALWEMHSGAIVWLDKDGEGDRWEWLHKSVGVATGALTGLVGAPGALFDLPITTANILRSVTDIARSFPDEDISSDDTKRACIELFAIGSPLADDDEAGLGYWAARSGLTHVAVEQLIQRAASVYAIAVSEKLLAQAVPVVGAVAGAALNYAFIDYYQEMARVHFMVRGVERRAPDASAIRPCLDTIVRELRSRRRGASGTKLPD
jgi:hypothetical protein